MCLIAYFKKLRQKHDELEFQRAMERLKKSGFHTIRLDEEMNFSFIKEDNTLQFNVSKDCQDKEERFKGFVELLDELHGEHREFEVDGSRVVFWDI